MNITFRKNLNISYMIIQAPKGYLPGDYSIGMLKYNDIPSLLKYSWEQINGKTNFLYDITSLQSLGKLSETEKMNHSKLLAFLDSLKKMFSSLEEYLLDQNDIIMNPECVFTDSTRSHFLFCCCPGYKGSLKDELLTLCNAMLSMIDYGDSDAISLIYDLNRIISADSFTISDLEDLTDNNIINGVTMAQWTQDNSAELKTKNPPFDSPTLKASSQNLASAPNPVPALNPIYASNPEINPLTFSAKLKGYFQGRTLSDIINDINSGGVMKRIKSWGDLSPSVSQYNRQAPQDKDYTKSTAVSFERMTEPGASLSLSGKPFTEAAAAFMEETRYAENPLEQTASIGSKTSTFMTITGLGALNKESAELTIFPFTIGTDPAANMRPPSRSVSRLHCRISKPDDISSGCSIEDLNSTNGTWLNGTPLEAYTPVPIKHGDIIRMADTEYIIS